MSTSEADVILTRRVAELPIPARKSTITLCLRCEERVWLADDMPRDIACVCTHCLEALAKEHRGK